MNFTALAGTKSLVIGANSFIGSHLVPELQKYGSRVYSASRSESPLFNGDSTGRYLDVTNLASVGRILEEIKPEYIFNLSGYVQGGRNLEHVWPCFKVNLEGTVNLLASLKQTPCKRLIITGSLDEYQPDNQLIRPVSPYAASKIAASAYARMFYTLFSAPVVIARPFMVYGPNQKDQQKLVPYTILSLLRGEEPCFSSGVRQADWVYVSDVVDGLIRAALTPGVEGATLPIGTGVLSSVREVVGRIFELLDAKVPPRFGEVADRKNETVFAADVEETRRLMGWEAQVTLEEGLARTVAWYKEQFTHLQPSYGV